MHVGSEDVISTFPGCRCSNCLGRQSHLAHRAGFQPHVQADAVAQIIRDRQTSLWRLRRSGCSRVQILQNCVANASASCLCKSCRNCGLVWRAAPAARFRGSIQCAIPDGKGLRESGSLRIWSRPWAQGSEASDWARSACLRDFGDSIRCSSPNGGAGAPPIHLWIASAGRPMLVGGLFPAKGLAQFLAVRHTHQRTFWHRRSASKKCATKSRLKTSKLQCGIQSALKRLAIWCLSGRIFALGVQTKSAIIGP